MRYDCARKTLDKIIAIVSLETRASADDVSNLLAILFCLARAVSKEASTPRIGGHGEWGIGLTGMSVLPNRAPSVG